MKRKVGNATFLFLSWPQSQQTPNSTDTVTLDNKNTLDIVKRRSVYAWLKAIRVNCNRVLEFFRRQLPNLFRQNKMLQLIKA